MNEFNKHFLSSCVPSTVLGIGDSVLWWEGHSYHSYVYILVFDLFLVFQEEIWGYII